MMINNQVEQVQNEIIEQPSFISRVTEFGYGAVDRVKRIENSSAALLTAALSSLTATIGIESILPQASSAEFPPQASLVSNKQIQKNRVEYSRDGKVCRFHCNMFGLAQSVEVESVTLQEHGAKSYIDVSYIDTIENTSSMPITLKSIKVAPNKRQTVNYVGTPSTQFQFPDSSNYTVKKAKIHHYPTKSFGREHTLINPIEPLATDEPIDLNIHAMISEKVGLKPVWAVQADALSLAIEGQPLSNGYGGSIYNRTTETTYIKTIG
jgi:hypothetical protein